jgi:hypothetical protein
VRTDYDHKADFEKYRTYSWLQAKASDSLWENRIMEAVDSQLAARGWTKAVSGGDASVAGVGTTRNEPTFTPFYDGMPGWRWRGVASDTLSSKPEKNDKKLDEAVQKMFDKFPPKSKD